MFFRIIVIAIIAAVVYFGVKRILRDWRQNFSDLDKKVHERDLKERERPDVITLKRDKDGVFKPGDDD